MSKLLAAVAFAALALVVPAAAQAQQAQPGLTAGIDADRFKPAFQLDKCLLKTSAAAQRACQSAVPKPKQVSNPRADSLPPSSSQRPSRRTFRRT